MTLVDYTRNKIKGLMGVNLIHYLIPLLLIMVLYGSFMPMDQGFIGEWHDITTNSEYYKLVGENYFTTWNNLAAGGFPLIASPHSDKYYPLSVPFYLIFKNLEIVNFILLFHLLISYFSFYKFGTLITKNNNALMIFSLIFTFSGALIGRMYAGHHLLFYGLVWIPLLYYFFFKITLFEEANVKNMMGLAVIPALIYLTGNIYHFVFMYMILGIFFLYYAVTGRISKKTLTYIILALVLMMLLISVKSIPDINVSGSILRQDTINPLEAGGSIERDLTGFISGKGIETRWGAYEGEAMIGIIPVLLAILALIYGRREIVIPAFLAITFSVVWAAGGNTFFSFIHLLPIISSFRNPGRIFGALLPIVLFLSLYGAILLSEMRHKKNFSISPEQKTHIFYGLGILGVVKLFELPFIQIPSLDVIISVLVVVAFIALLLLQKGSMRNISIFMLVGLALSCFQLWAVSSFQGLIQPDMLLKFLIVNLCLLGLWAWVWKAKGKQKVILPGLLILSISLLFVGNMSTGYITLFTPQFNQSPAQAVTERLIQASPEIPQIWVYETGIPIAHQDFTHWDIARGIQPMTLYAAYFLKTMPQLTYNIGGLTYFSADYVVDTLYLENGQQNLPQTTFKVENISIYKPDLVLPNAFILRNEKVLPLVVEEFKSGDVTVRGDFLPGDAVVLKSAYYPGWKANEVEARNLGNMVGTQITQQPDNKMRFTFDPPDYKVGAILSLVGVALLLSVIIKRREIETYLAGKNRKFK